MRYWMKLPFVLMFFAVAAHSDPLQKTFSDWQITCNNQNHCVTRNFPGDRGLVMTISRQAGTDDRPLLRIDYGNRFSGELSGAALQDNLLLDGQLLKLDLKHWDVQTHHLTTSDAISINEFLLQVMDANNIQLLYRPRSFISLHGLKAALLLMDESQGRVNSTSAWIKPGSRSDVLTSTTQPEPSAPRIVPLALSQEETAGLIDFGTWRVNTDRCSLDPQRREVSVAPLSDKQALLLVSCEMGAYNVIDLAFEVTRTPPYVARRLTLTLPFVPPHHSDKKLELINAQYDASKSELLTYSKGRGLGDCGTATRWQYNGREFVLAEYAEESTCDAWHSSDDWPTLWTSSTREAPAAASRVGD